MRKHFLLAILLYAASAGAATNLTIHSKNGSSRDVALSSVRTLTFKGDTLCLNYKNGSTESEQFGTIQKLFFTSVANSSKPVNAEKIEIAPNPVSKSFRMSGLSTASTRVSIWNIAGQKMLETTLSPNQAIDVSTLPAGLYLVRANTTTLKMMKQ